MKSYYQCTNCKELKPPDCFAKNKNYTHRDGLNYWCKSCTKWAHHKWSERRHRQRDQDKQPTPEEHTIINPFVFQDGGHELRAEDLGATNIALRLIPTGNSDETASILLSKETKVTELISWLEKAIT